MDFWFGNRHLLFFFSVLFFTVIVAAAAEGDQWYLLKSSIGVSAMHMQLLNTDRVVVFDTTSFGPSNLSLPAGAPCPRGDCAAHSAEYDVAAASVRPLTILTDTWCSSGAVVPDGTLVQTGGFDDGDSAVRTFRPCLDAKCDWSENPRDLLAPRWYASNQILPDGRVIIIGGRGQPSYEFHPKNNPSDSSPILLHFLNETSDPEENNLYPFVHLNIDGNLFIFANNRAILLDYAKNAVVRTYPEMPGGDPRNYPSTGSSVLLPLKPSPAEAEVLVCGGAPTGSYLQASRHGTFVRALDTCGRIKITDEAPTWAMETMPMPRVMGDMVLLPSGDEVLVINGAGAGAAGWELGRDPVLTPLVYRPDGPAGKRFEVQGDAAIPRMYHSTAVLLRDGRVFVGGSNPHGYYNFTGVDYPTELSVEAFYPSYLSAANAMKRPTITTATASPSPTELSYGKQFKLQFTVGAQLSGSSVVSVTMVFPSFATHSFSMSQRVLILATGKPAELGNVFYEVKATAPASPVVAPPGYYMVFVVNDGIPSEGIWVHIQ